MDNQEPVPSLAEQAYLRLRQEILVCTLAPGQVLTERELAGRYEMSKTPIREALTQVCHDGLVQRLPGRGYMVAPITVKDLRDLFDMRLILEVAAAERATREPSPALVAELKTLAIHEKHGNEHGAAITYHHLGIIAEEQRDFTTAEEWYLKSLAIFEKQGDEHGAARTYHHLGMIAGPCWRKV